MIRVRDFDVKLWGHVRFKKVRTPNLCIWYSVSWNTRALYPLLIFQRMIVVTVSYLSHHTTLIRSRVTTDKTYERRSAKHSNVIESFHFDFGRQRPSVTTLWTAGSWSTEKIFLRNEKIAPEVTKFCHDRCSRYFQNNWKYVYNLKKLRKTSEYIL